MTMRPAGVSKAERIIAALQNAAYQDPESYEWVVPIDDAIDIIKKEIGL